MRLDELLTVKKAMAEYIGHPDIPVTQGKVIFLDPLNGSDASNGETVGEAVASFAVAEGLLTANQNDILCYLAGSTSLTVTASMDWDKNYTHFIGVGAPTGRANRARIFHSGNISPMLNITATGCMFDNFYMSHGNGNAANLIGIYINGCGRNYFSQRG